MEPRVAPIDLARHQRELEPARHHADDFVRLEIQQDRSSQYPDLAMETAAPGPVAENHDLLAAVIFSLGSVRLAERVPPLPPRGILFPFDVFRLRIASPGRPGNFRERPVDKSFKRALSLNVPNEKVHEPFHHCFPAN